MAGRDAAVIEFLVPYYGSPEYLHQTIASVRALEDTDWRLTIVEDAFPDGPAVESTVLALGDDRIRYLRNEQNLGNNANTYRCIELARGDWFAMPGADDLVNPNYGRAVADLIRRHPNAAMVQPAVEVIDEDGQPHFPLPDKIKRLTRPGHDEVVLKGDTGAASLLRSNWLYTPASCYRREHLQKVHYRADIDAAHDLAFIVDVLMAGGEIAVGTEVAFRYRRHGTSHSSAFARSGRRFEQERKYFEDIQIELAALGWKTAERAARRRLLSRLNALSQLPGAALARDGGAAKAMLRHGVR
ncbi:glycosyltransferase [Catenulispora pinisilvae]|uniref:glycosyltransferase n=1 Tax=Catenulispora pinisilvae TaxID=2705253 RepID=UPI001891FF0D|nr:glycosyltransferase [Catenulispora pinisilvae]